MSAKEKYAKHRPVTTPPPVRVRTDSNPRDFRRRVTGSGRVVSGGRGVLHTGNISISCPFAEFNTPPTSRQRNVAVRSSVQHASLLNLLERTPNRPLTWPFARKDNRNQGFWFVRDFFLSFLPLSALLLRKLLRYTFFTLLFLLAAVKHFRPF